MDYIFGKNFILYEQRSNDSEFVKQAYQAYFGVKHKDQNKYKAPRYACIMYFQKLLW